MGLLTFAEELCCQRVRYELALGLCLCVCVCKLIRRRGRMRKIRDTKRAEIAFLFKGFIIGLA